VAKIPYIERNCIKCGPTKSQRWYYNNTTCRSCHRKAVKETPRYLFEKAYKIWLKQDPVCWDCGNTESYRWYKDNTQCAKCQRRQYTSKNIDRIKKQKIEYRLKNKELINRTKRAYRAKTGLHRYNESKRKAIKKRALPKWANLEDIKLFYKNCPEGYTVDHIIPLKSDLVCGLHISWNFQYLTLSENSRKHNKFDLTYENKGYKWL